MGSSWGILGASWRLLGASWRLLGASWGRLEASRAILGSWEQPNSKNASKPIFVGRPTRNPRFGLLVGSRNAPLKCLGSVLGTSRGTAGASWDILRHLGSILAYLGASWGLLGTSWGIFGASWGHLGRGPSLGPPPPPPMTEIGSRGRNYRRGNQWEACLRSMVAPQGGAGGFSATLPRAAKYVYNSKAAPNDPVFFNTYRIAKHPK